jgi:hypothetical protein
MQVQAISTYEHELFQYINATYPKKTYSPGKRACRRIQYTEAKKALMKKIHQSPTDLFSQKQKSPSPDRR